MKPRLDHLIQRPFAYRTSKETSEPGYLQERFRAIRAQQKRAAEQEAQRAVERAAKVRALVQAPVRTAKKGAA